MNRDITNLFSGPLVTAISHTLAHSLWQGALLSAITGLIMACTRRLPAALRYNLLVTAMALFVATVACTFCMEYNAGTQQISATIGRQAVVAVATPNETIQYPAPPGLSIPQTVGEYLNRYGAVIVWAWLLIVCTRCVQMATGFRQIYRLRHKNTSTAGSYWQQRVRQLCGQLGIKRVVGIAQSSLAKTPMVTGHLKPLILIPLGMLNSLSVEETEAVLLHELAHTRRADYLVNLLQNMMEIIFFFNPAVLWLSALIKAERENCCDDIAVARRGKLDYLKALVACEQYKMHPLPYAMGLHTRAGSLKSRATRIIYNKNQSLNRAEVSLLAVCLVAVGIFATAFAQGGNTGEKASISQKKTFLPQMKNSLPDNNYDTALTQRTTDSATKHANAATAFATNGQSTEDKPASDSERTANIINDMLKDGIITTPSGLSFKIGTDEFVVNYVKQPDAVYQKYRVKYVKPQYSGPHDWIWYYEFDTQKYQAIVAHQNIDAQGTDTTTGVFKGKLN